ncbi:hypothetical protein HYW11_01550 [Candidatus Peregrinibacteria bacterium]|nr:hypothetical protein [Candidatus Peregrinibacteria bacterium]
MENGLFHLWYFFFNVSFFFNIALFAHIRHLFFSHLCHFFFNVSLFFHLCHFFLNVSLYALEQLVDFLNEFLLLQLRRRRNAWR